MFRFFKTHGNPAAVAQPQGQMSGLKIGEEFSFAFVVEVDVRLIRPDSLRRLGQGAQERSLRRG
jgi:hypothetical protein